MGKLSMYTLEFFQESLNEEYKGWGVASIHNSIDNAMKAINDLDCTHKFTSNLAGTCDLGTLFYATRKFRIREFEVNAKTNQWFGATLKLPVEKLTNA